MIGQPTGFNPGMQQPIMAQPTGAFGAFGGSAFGGQNQGQNGSGFNPAPLQSREFPLSANYMPVLTAVRCRNDGLPPAVEPIDVRPWTGIAASSAAVAIKCLSQYLARQRICVNEVRHFRQ